MKIIGIIGSLRKDSLNLKLAKIVKNNLKNIDFEIFTLEEIPFFNEDLEEQAPKAVTSLREKIKDADAVWFFCPEYNHSYSGVMKNTIDWLSRHYDDKEPVLKRKKAILSGVSIGRGATLAAQDELVKVLSYIDMEIMNHPKLSLANSELPDDDNKRLQKIIEAALKFIEK